MVEPGRNEPCPCGSGKKYKLCHLPKDEAKRRKDAAASAVVPEEKEEAKKEDEPATPPRNKANWKPKFGSK